MSEPESWRPAYIDLSLRVKAGELTAADAEQNLISVYGDASTQSEWQYIKTLMEHPFWPIGLCIAWILKRQVEDAAERWRQHRMWSEVGFSDGWPDARDQLRKSLLGDEVNAVGVCQRDSLRVKIPAMEWLDLRLQQVGNRDVAYGLDEKPRYDSIQIQTKQILELWPAPSTAERKVRLNVAAETACRKELIAMMRAAPQQPIAKSVLKANFRDLGQNAFNRAFTNAVADASTPAWRAAGRRKKSPQQ